MKLSKNVAIFGNTGGECSTSTKVKIFGQKHFKNLVKLF
jgi:hypothetical protein